MAFISRIVRSHSPWYCEKEIQYNNGPLYRYTESRSMGYPVTISCSIRRDETSELLTGLPEEVIKEFVYVWTAQGFKWPRYDVVMHRRPGAEPPEFFESYWSKDTAERRQRELIRTWGSGSVSIRRVDWEEYSKEND